MPINLVDTQAGHAVLHHYFTKSREEWIRRRRSPRADRIELSYRNREMFERYWSLPATDQTARRQAPRLRDGINRLDQVIEEHDGRLGKLEVQMIAITATSVIGRVTGGPVPAGLTVRTVIDGVEERLAPVALGTDGRVFRCGVRWSGTAVTTAARWWASAERSSSRRRSTPTRSASWPG